LVVRRSVLMWFIGHKCHLDSISALLKAKADVNFVNEEGETALDLAQAAHCSEQVDAPHEEKERAKRSHGAGVDSRRSTSRRLVPFVGFNPAVWDTRARAAEMASSETKGHWCAPIFGSGKETGEEKEHDIGRRNAEARAHVC
jgi:hypothetical protein